MKKVEPTNTPASKLWDEIKVKKIDMFALPNQTVEMHCEPVVVDPTRLFLKPKSNAVLPSLEAALGDSFSIELAKHYLIVTKK